MTVTDLGAERAKTLDHAKSIVARAKSANRDLTDSEQGQLEADVARVKELDQQQKGRNLVNSVMRLGGDWQDTDHQATTRRPRSSPPKASPEW